MLKLLHNLYYVSFLLFFLEYKPHIGSNSLFSDFVAFITIAQADYKHLMNIYWSTILITCSDWVIL